MLLTATRVPPQCHKPPAPTAPPQPREHRRRLPSLRRTARLGAYLADERSQVQVHPVSNRIDLWVRHGYTRLSRISRSATAKASTPKIVDR